MDEAELQRDLGRDDAAAQHPVERTCQTHEPGDPLCPARPGNDAGAHLGVSVAEVAVLADPEVAGEGQFEAAAHGVPVHRGDDHFRQRRHLVEDRLIAAHEGAGEARQRRVAGQPVELLHAVLGEEAGVLRP